MGDVAGRPQEEPARGSETGDGLDVEVREATRADAPEIEQSLLRPGLSASEAIAPEFNALSDAAQRATCAYWLDDDDRAIFVAVTEDEYTGYVSICEVQSPPIYARGPRGHIDGLYVKPAFRRDGVASRLIDAAAEWARERDCSHLGVTAHAKNQAATSLYDDAFSLKYLSYRRRLD